MNLYTYNNFVIFIIYNLIEILIRVKILELAYMNIIKYSFDNK